MQLICEGHPQIEGFSQGVQLVLNRSTVLDEPVLQGDSDADATGTSIYGSVLRDGGKSFGRAQVGFIHAPGAERSGPYEGLAM